MVWKGNQKSKYKEEMIFDIYRDVLKAVSQGKLNLIKPEQVSSIITEGSLYNKMEIKKPEEVGAARKMAAQLLEEEKMPRQYILHVALCVSEAATNIIKHAAEGDVEIRKLNDIVRVIFRDHGPGMDIEKLPNMIFLKGYSTKESLGFGFSIIYKFADKIYLDTSEKGTLLIMDFLIQRISTLKEQSLNYERLLSAAIKDITEFRHTQDTSSLAYAELNQVFNTVAESIRVIDLDYNILKVNNAFCAISGMQKDEIIGKKCYHIFRGEECHTDDCVVNRILNGSEHIEQDVEKQRNDGTLVPCIVTATPLRDPNGKLVGIVEVFKDITERKRMEEELYEQKIFTEKLIQHTAVPTFVINTEHKVISWNRACEMLTSVKADKVVDSSDISRILYGDNRPLLADLIVESKLEDLPLFYSKYKKSNILPEGFQGEGWFTNIGNQNRYLIFDTAPIYNNKGEVIVVIETLQDITERKLAEDALQERNEKVQTELKMAEKVQQGLLPKELPEVTGVSFSWEFKPSIYISGDMLNVFKLDENQIGFYVLDVMGHGISAALKAVTLSYLLQPLSYNNGIKNNSDELILPSQIFKNLNTRFSDEFKNVSFFTIFYGILDTQNYKLIYARAGHCPPLVITKNQQIIELEQGGPALGLSKDVTHKDYTLDLNPGDRLLLYTDGLVDAKNTSGNPYSKKLLRDFLLKNQNMNINDLTHSVVTDVMQYIGNKDAEDDLTLMGIEIPNHEARF